MKKKIIIIVAVIFVIAGAFWAKAYYNDRYVASEIYYTQVPEDEVNEDSWLVDSDGVKQEKGKEYKLIGYDENGNEKEVYFSVKGTSENYYAPGTYIQVKSSKTLVLGNAPVEKSAVPQAALKQIQENGTRIK